METIVWFKDILAFRNYLSNQQSLAGYICLAIAESVLVCLCAESAQPVKVEGDSHNPLGNLPPSGKLSHQVHSMARQQPGVEIAQIIVLGSNMCFYM